MTKISLGLSAFSLLLACGFVGVACSDSKSSSGPSSTGGAGGEAPGTGGASSGGASTGGTSSGGGAGEGSGNEEDKFFGGNWIDHDGNMYIADTMNCVVRKVSPQGDIDTVAGTPEDCGDEGDGGPATEAKLSLPVDVALGPDGDLYIVDGGNDRVRRVDAQTGVISAFAGNGVSTTSGDGGPATDAGMGGPVGLVVDAEGNVFIVEVWGSVVRRVAAGTGVITTVAGNGDSGDEGDGGPATDAELDEPAGLALDAEGNLYIGSYVKVRKVAVDGTITTVAGTGTFGVAGDGGPALEADVTFAPGIAFDAAGNMYILDMANHAVRKVDADTGVLSTIAGTLSSSGSAGDGGPATAAYLRHPGKLAFDRDGHLYIADTENHRIRRVHATTGVITTVAGTGTDGFTGDGGPARDAQLHEPSSVFWFWD